MIDMVRAFPVVLILAAPVTGLAAENVHATEKSEDLDVESARVSYREDINLLVFEITVHGEAGGTTPEANGQLDGAPVLGYVFPTTLTPEDVGFGSAVGIVALAATSHPDFDDTPLWDENGNLVYDDDGRRFHSHWVLLVKDDRVEGGLSVRELPSENVKTELPPTNPGMPMYLDSPGFSIVLRGNVIRVLVPADRVRGNRQFQFDAVTAYMEVNQTDNQRPMLGVYEVYSVLSGDLSLPYTVTSGR